MDFSPFFPGLKHKKDPLLAFSGAVSRKLTPPSGTCRKLRMHLNQISTRSTFMNINRVRQAEFGPWIVAGLVMSVLFGCSPKAIMEQKPKIPVYRYEQVVHNDGFRGKFAFETHEVISVTPERKATDTTFGFTGMIMSKLMKKRHNINIIRLDKDLVWDMDLNEKTYTERPITKLPTLDLKAAAPPQAGAEDVYVEDCCRLVTDVKRTGVEKVVNGYDATQVLFTAHTECKDASEPTSTKFSMEVWYAQNLNLGDELTAFDAAYAQKVGFNPEMMSAMGDQALKMFPGLMDLAAMMGQIKGYPVLTIITVEDEKLLERLKEERAQAASQESETPTSTKALVTGFFSRKLKEHERKKQAEEDLKWGNTVFKMSVEASNFGPADVSASVFDLAEGLKKMETEKGPVDQPAAPASGEKPANYVPTACFSTLDKADLGVELYPKAVPARERPYGVMDHNTRWYYKDDHNYRLQYATSDSFEKVVDFYKERLGADQCNISKQQNDGVAYSQAVCTGHALTFSMDDKPLEVQSAWSAPAGSQVTVETQNKRLAFILSRGSGTQ